MEKKYLDILKKTTILLVDDDESLRRIFKKTISSFVNFVYEASNGSEALEVYHKQKPHIVITDIKMPLMDGLSFTTALREIDKKVTIVVISAYSESNTLVKLVSLGLQEYLVKPINFEQLKSVLVKCAVELENKGTIEIEITKDTKYSYYKKSLVKNGKIISLTPNEIKMIELLLENENRLVSISTIEDNVYNNEFVVKSSINILVSKLRKKIGVNNIKSISSHGYILTKEL
jgi:DNA-binding response OmpR family regulator